jgi:hypothetical protein
MLTTNLKKIRKLRKKSKFGWYTISPDGKTVVYSDSDDELETYLKALIGQWSLETADEWAKWVIFEFDEQGESSYHY